MAKFYHGKLYIDDGEHGYSDNIGLRGELNRVFFENRTILLSSEITQYDASTIAGLILVLSGESNKEITLMLNSPGGAIEGFLAIYDVMQLVEAPIKTIVLGDASSAAAMLLAAGSKGLRFATQNAYIMIHEIQLSGGSEGSTTEVEKEMKACKKMNKRILEILAQHVGKPYRRIQRDCKNNKYMTADEALKYGIVDKIILPHKFIPKLKAEPKPRKNVKREDEQE